MREIFRMFIKAIKDAQRFEKQIVYLKAVTERAKTKKVRISENQLKILIACGLVGISTDREIHELTGTEKLHDMIEQSNFNS